MSSSTVSAPPPVRSSVAPNAPTLSPRAKALRINLDGPPYGTLAEIGAGQEVANWFFRAGAASGSIAKTMSAYDMTVSDAVYGPAKQYVSRERLLRMLDREYTLLFERLDAKMGDDSLFFAYANTVRVRAYGDTNQECHGWMGLRLQTRPHGPPHDIIIHARFLDDELNEQQEAVGRLGVNLIYAALYLRDDLRVFVESLRDHLPARRVSVDFLKMTGPDFHGLDNRLGALQLVESGLSSSAFFTAGGEVMQAAEFFYKKPLLLLRGRFDPVTNVHLDMIASARREMTTLCAVEDGQAAGLASGDVVEIFELSMHNLREVDGPEVDKESFLARADVLQALGENVLISAYPEFHRLGAFLSRSTKAPIGIVLSRSLLEELFEEKWYAALDGGLLESLGRLFKHRLRLYVYPELDHATGELRGATEAAIAPHLRKLFEHLLDNKFIVSIPCGDVPGLKFTGPEIRSLMRAGDPLWKTLVPDAVAAAYTAWQARQAAKAMPVTAEGPSA